MLDAVEDNLEELSDYVDKIGPRAFCWLVQVATPFLEQVLGDEIRWRALITLLDTVCCATDDPDERVQCLEELAEHVQDTV